VQGKGGLIREVLIPAHLAAQLEARRLPAPIKITDRGVYYCQHYQIAGGHTWSSAFSQASTRALGWSAGGHALRYLYAQERMLELRMLGLSRNDSLLAVSQELGILAPSLVETYLR